MEHLLRRFIALATNDSALQSFAEDRAFTTHYVLREPALEFYMRFQDGEVRGDMGAPPAPAEVRLEMKADVFDGLFAGRIEGMRAAMTGKLSFSGDMGLALGMQRIQGDLNRLYNLALEGSTESTSH